jgi:hypothetical protein
MTRERRVSHWLGTSADGIGGDKGRLSLGAAFLRVMGCGFYQIILFLSAPRRTVPSTTRGRGQGREKKTNRFYGIWPLGS